MLNNAIRDLSHHKFKESSLKKITNLYNFIFYYKDSVFKAMEKLNNKDVSFLVIINKQKLLGTITDVIGDIRRHILRGNSLNQSIEIAMKKKPVFSYIDQENTHKKNYYHHQLLNFYQFLQGKK